MQFYTLVIILLVQLALAQKQSPCPSILAYEAKGSEPNRWYARITTTTSEELNGVWLRVQLDQRVEELGNWFGKATSDDNKHYLIKNRHYHLQPNSQPLNVRFFVKYNLEEATVPSVIRIRLNGQVICPSTANVSTSKPTTPQTVINNRQPVSVDTGNDDIFLGDLGSRRPVVKPESLGILEFSCGTVRIPALSLITYGEETSKGQWPWHAAMYLYKGVNLEYICGASLISKNHILTAAHCAAKLKTNIPISTELLLIYLGKYNLHKQDNNVQTREVATILIHPQYNASNSQNDLAVLHLANPVDITNFVRYVCLWEEDINFSGVVEKLGTVIGFGFDQTGEITPNLMQAQMPVVSIETCIFSNRDFFSQVTSEKTYCAGFRNGTSACNGDSGGGMVFPKTGTSGQYTVWQLRGVVSLSAGVEQNGKTVCDTSNYIVFTDVAKHLDWIRSAMKN